MAKSVAYAHMRRALIALVNDVPRGRVCELPALAAALNIPPRHAAYMLATLTPDEAALIAWHRIVPAGGRFTVAKRKSALGADQIRTLETEGLGLMPDGTIRAWPEPIWAPPLTHAGTLWADEADAD
jgi:methylated-DNA-protein-cysteine methyltransferase-like protein